MFRLVLFVICTIALLCIYWLTAAFERDRVRHGITWRARWIAVVPHLMGIRMVYFNENFPAEASLYMANHRSYLDPAAILAHLDAVVIAKQEVARWPLIGLAAKAAGVLFVRREARGSRRAVLQASLDLVQRGVSVLNFPEGTTTMAPDLGEFKPGAFVLAADHGIAVVPVAIEYKDRRDAWIGDDTFLRHFFQMFAKDNIQVMVSFGPVLYSREADWLREMSRSWIRRNLDRSRESGWGKPVQR